MCIGILAGLQFQDIITFQVYWMRFWANKYCTRLALTNENWSKKKLEYVQEEYVARLAVTEWSLSFRIVAKLGRYSRFGVD